MANPYFEFKKFRVDQGKCAMKVGTLACILGAYSNFPDPRHILDIGTGTGLLALMLAQRYPGTSIDAVEIETATYGQACENAASSPWGKDISLFHADIASFNPPHGAGYELIVSNPPFFENHKKSSDSKINMARHDDSLKMEKLLAAVSKLLTPWGRFFVLLPPSEAMRLGTLAPRYGLFPSAHLEIYNFPNKPCKAVILTLGRQKDILGKSAFYIWRGQGAYSDEFIGLLKEYYLNF